MAVRARIALLAVMLFFLGSCSTVHNYANGWEEELAGKTAVIRKTTADETVRTCNYRFQMGAFPPFIFLGACTAWVDAYSEEGPEIEVVISDWSLLKHELYQAAMDWVNVGHRGFVLTKWPTEAISLEAEASAEGFGTLLKTLEVYDRQDFIVSFTAFRTAHPPP